MKKIDTLQVTDPSTLQPFTARSLKFLQDATAEDVAAIIKSIVTSNLGSYSLSVPYVISGCVYDNSSLYGVTSGEIFYGGKYYETTAIPNDTATNIPRFILTLSQDATADPVIFSDSSSKNVHNIEKYVATDVASGGDFTAANLVSLYGTKLATQITLATQTTTVASYVDMTGLTYTNTLGVSKAFKLTLKGTAEISAASGTPSSAAEGIFKIINFTTTTDLDITTVGVEVIVVAATVDVVGKVPFICQTIVTLNNNDVVKCQFYDSADGVTAVNVKFLIEQL